MLTEGWHIQLLGGLRMEQGRQSITRFRTQKTGALLAYLAFYRDRLHPRDVLADLFWPDDDPDAARASFRTALNSLRKQLESPHVAPQSVLIADRFQVQLRSDNVTTDVSQFLEAIQEARRCVHLKEQAGHLLQAVQAYGGELLPGFYEDWVIMERQALESVYMDALRQLLSHAEGEADFTQALDYATRIVALDPTAEEAHVAVIRLFHKAGRPREALRQYDTLERTLQSQLNAVPTQESRRLVDSIRTTVTRPVTVRRGHRQVPTLPVVRSTPSAPRREAREPAPSLPIPLLPFFGREADIERIMELLQPGSRSSSSLLRTPSPAVRLLTLLGPGGSGKTRLAIEVARQLQRAFAGSVWFVSLADLSEAGMVPEAILEAMELPRKGGGAWFAALQQSLGERSGLLILDNFEHLVEAGTQYVRDLLLHVPGLVCVTTSRLKLDIEGERVFMVAPLPVPKSDNVAPKALLEYPSVQLFVERAQAARIDFQITERNAVAITELTRRLEGLPLAIELAAAWAQMLTPSQMLERLENRFQMLVSRRRDPVPRHRSLHAAIGSSYALLPSEAQRLFCQLAVFRGGFRRDAAVEVCGSGEPDGTNADRIEDLLLLLQKHSLLDVEEWDETLRFTMLESLREFALEQLSADDRFSGALAHARWCRRLTYQASIAEPQDLPLWKDVLFQEQENVRAALAFCLQPLPSGAESDPNGAQQLAAQLGRDIAADLPWYWQWRGAYAEGRRWLEQALRLSEGSDPNPETENLRFHLAGLAFFLGLFPEAEAHCRTSLDRWQDDWDPVFRGKVLSRLGQTYGIQRDYGRAEPLLQESLAVFKAALDWKRASDALNGLGIIAKNRGDFVQARRYLEEGLDYDRQLNDTRFIYVKLVNLSLIAMAQKEYRVAELQLTECLEMVRALGERPGISLILHNLCLVTEEHSPERALAYLHESMKIRREMQDRHGIILNLSLLGDVMQKREPLRAVRFYAFARMLMETSGTRDAFANPERVNAFLEEIKTANPEAAVVWNLSLVVPPEAAIEEALEFCSTAAKLPHESAPSGPR